MLSPWMLVGGALFLLFNLTNIRQVIAGGTPTDWWNYVLAGRHALAGEPIFTAGNWFNYSPVLAFAFGIILPPLGLIGWQALHVAAAAAMPRPLGLIALLSFPWWWDVLSGNVLTFIVLAAAWALRGKGWAIGTTFVLALLIPRPLMVPLVLWLLWKHPRWRLGFVVIAVVLGVGAVATGQGLEWANAIRYGAQDIGHEWNMSPSQVIGWWWILAGIPLGAVLLWRGYVGLACLAVSPYLLPQYLVLALLDLAPRRDDDHAIAAGPTALGAGLAPAAATATTGEAA